MPLLYDIGLGLYHAGIRAAGMFNPKARSWSTGREGIWERLEAKRKALQGCIWMHSASVGEFEQGLPVLEKIKAARPELPVLLTFYSPSGYEARKSHPLATHVEYLPADNAANAQRFLELVQPKAVLWVKYEFWFHQLTAIKRAGVPAFLVSGIFRPSQPFFHWYGATHKRMLACFERIFVQDSASQELLRGIGITNVVVSGDTRFDRVDAIAREDARLPLAQAYHRAMDAPVLIAGSSWPADEDLLLEAFKKLQTPPRLVLVPHEVSRYAIDRAAKRMPQPVQRWSQLEERLASTDVPIAAGSAPDEDPLFARTLIVDRMGLLSRLYQHANIAYVGGGFGDGIHSLLEAAAWGRPVIFGPRHSKFAEAKGLIEAGGGFEVRDADELAQVLEKLFTDERALQEASLAALSYVRERIGATEKVVERVSRSL